MFNNWTFGPEAGRRLRLVGLDAGPGCGRVLPQRLPSDRERPWVAHSHQVRTELADLLSEMKDAETGQRGYVITGEDSYLEPYKAALGTIKTTFADVRKLTADNPEQQRRLTAMAPLIDTKLAELKQTSSICAERKASTPPPKSSLTNAGKTHMDQIRAIVGEADQRRARAAATAVRRSARQRRHDHAIILWGGLLGTLAVGVIGWFITRSLSQQIGSAVGQVQSSSAELQAAANQQATGAKEQATAMTEISTTISELLATSRQIAESAQRVAQIAEQTAARRAPATAPST